MRALLVDDHLLFLQGLQFLLQDLDPALVCQTATSVAEALSLPGPFDVILLDYRLPDSDGASGLQRVRAAHAQATVVMLSSMDDESLARELMDQGAAGYVPKSADTPALIQALRTVLRGGSFPSSATAVRSRPSDTSSATVVAALSPRQVDCLLALAEGKSNKAIARDLGLADSSVKTHLSAAFRTLGVTNRTEAVYKAAALGLVPGMNG
ncbi:response regulator [Hydrogenophaga soli]|nr:response regulator transcription factor [Burkholderiaceae bacterium]